MKIRSSFVANSSSSSFIIAVKDITLEESVKTLPSWIKKQAEIFVKRVTNGSRYDEGFKTKEELDKHFMSNYHYGETTLEEFLDEDDYLQTKYNNILTAINNGFVVYETSIDNCDESGHAFYRNLPEKDDGSGIYLLESEC